MQLVRLDSQAENDFVRANLPDDAWIGASDSAVENAWRWSDSGAQFWSGRANGNVVGGLFARWKSNAPDDLFGQDCGRIDDSDGRWDDRSCSEQNEYACERVVDGCPNDDAKGSPGVCGCGIADVDTDGDGTLDCQDGCPTDPKSLVPGQCGCLGEPNLKAPGTSCSDGLCSANDECDGAGSCGSPQECAPATNCTVAAYDDHAYAFCPTDKTWSNARASCQSVPGMDLVNIDDAPEDTFVWNNIPAPTWIGANDRGVEGTWRWANDDTQIWSGKWYGSATAGAYTNWYAFQPDDLLFVEDCATHKKHDNAWRDENCSLWFDYACEAEPPTCDNSGECGCCGAGEACGGSGDPEVCGEHAPAEPCTLRTFGDHDYWFCGGEQTWQEARTRCQAVDADLVVIESEVENTFVANNAAGPAAGPKWIGLSDAAQSNHFTWVGGGQPAFTYWLPLEPSHTAGGQPEDCALIGKSATSPHQWADVSCGSTTASSQTIGYVCEDGRGIDQLGDDLEAHAVELALLTQEQSAPGFDPAQRERTQPRRDRLSYEIDRMIRLLPADTAVSPTTDLAPSVRALGRVLLARTVLQVDSLGHRPGGTCSNVFVAQRDADGSADSPLARYFDAVAMLASVPARQEAVWALTRLQGAIRCLDSRDLTRLDSGVAEAFMGAMERLRASGKTVIANALFDRSLPVAILLFDAVKSHRLPAVTWLLRFPVDISKLPQAQLAANEGAIGRVGWANLPEWDETLTARLYCDGDATNYTVSRLGMWVEDPIHGGSLNRAPLNKWSSPLQVSGPCLALHEISEVMSLGAGDCSLMEMAYSAWRCMSERTCLLPPPDQIDPNAPRGSVYAARTVLATDRTEAKDHNCSGQRLGLSVDRRCLSAMVAGTGHLLPTDPGGMWSCVIDAIGDPSAIRFLSTYERSEGCIDPYAQDGADPAGSGGQSGSTFSTEEIKNALERAGRLLANDGDPLYNAARNVAGAGGLSGTAYNNFQGAAGRVSDAFRANSGVDVTQANLSGNREGECVQPCDLDQGLEIRIDKAQIEAVAFGGLPAVPAPGTIEACRADPACRGALNTATQDELVATLRHEGNHAIIGTAQADGAFTDDGKKRLDAIDKEIAKSNPGEAGCALDDTKKCKAEHQIIHGAGLKQCAADMPCASELCLQPDGVAARLLGCASVDPAQLFDPRCWHVNPCSYYQSVLPECVSGNSPIAPDSCTLVQCGPDLAQSLGGSGGCCALDAGGAVALPCQALPASCENECCWDCAACPAMSYADAQAEPLECLCELADVVVE